MAFFRSTNLGDPEDAFVAWVDVMGCQNLMNGPIRVAAQSIYKLHVAALEARDASVRLYPVMDGVYAVSANEDSLKGFLKSLYGELAAEFIKDSGKPSFQFLIRGAVAHGEVYHGYNLPPDASKTLAANKKYAGNIVIGLPIVSAHLAESDAPPFGINIHESCGKSFPESRVGNWWQWFDDSLRDDFHRELDLYFKGARKFFVPKYPLSRIIVHEALGFKYFKTG